MTNSDAKTNGVAKREGPTAMTDEMRDAAMAEILGDVHGLHTSVKDLVAIVRDSDERISGRIVELRQVASDFAAAREAAIAQLATHASETAHRRFTDSMGDLLTRVDMSLVGIERLVLNGRDRRLFDLVAAAFMSGGITAVVALVGVWLMVH
jgi:hypothetical protein